MNKLKEISVNNIQKGGCMTHNQIDYWSLQESKRHNQQVENEASRHNVSEERETNRHNIETEKFNISNLNETQRHNVATEGESKRHNIAAENETNRHNVSTEQQANRELAETNRHNAISEYHQAVDLNVDAGRAAEQQRHNIATEQNATAMTNETIRHNQAQEAIQRAQVAFDAQYKQTMADVSRFQSSAGAALTIAQQREIDARIKKMQEDIKIAQQSNTVRAWDSAQNAATNLSKILVDVMRLWTRK